MAIFRAAPWWFPHIFSSVVATLFIWCVSQTSLVTSGVQFVGPMIVIMVCHLLYLAMTRGLVSGFATDLFGRCFATVVIFLMAVFLTEAVLPKPAQAQGTNIMTVLAGVAFCVVIAAVVLAVIGGVLWLLFEALKFLFGRKPDDPSSRFFDIGATVVTFAGLLALSAEGVPSGYSLGARGQGTATVMIDAPAEAVRVAMQTATAPEFPLPRILSGFPQPVAVEIDQGVGLGAMRVVRFEGREGIGYLQLQVTEADPNRVVFFVLSDTSPFVNWIGFDRLVYELRASDTGSELSVLVDFERRLAPKIVFGPMMQGAAHLAMSVLANDVKTRAEGL